MQRLVAVLERIELLLPVQPPTDFESSPAFRWRKRRYLGIEQGQLQAVVRPALIAFDDLKHIDQQKDAIRQNTVRFVRGLPANNVLLTGARGTGKSSLIRACLQAFAAQGLRLIEVDKRDLIDIADIVDLIAARNERFVVFCDDLSFDANEAGYKELKAALDGSIAGAASNVLIYASSNRRHLMPEMMRDNLETRYDDDGEIYPTEAVEERISLSERFGLWLSFYPFRQDDYLDIVAHWLARFGSQPREVEQARSEALQFALQRGSRSGRVALQFARHWAGSRQLSASDTAR
ncbi:MAG TPA: ATP-binding protein, partial [Burkholderiaceae bacterium]|nr:ATP-binding protein [Burkholderiaceae bacterium]